MPSHAAYGSSKLPELGSLENLKLGLFYMEERWDCWVLWLGKGLFKRNNTELIVRKIPFDK
jgi:hypothetical protein